MSNKEEPVQKSDHYIHMIFVKRYIKKIYFLFFHFFPSQAALPRATKIDLSSNQLTSLPPNFAQNLSSITHLELGSNKIKELPQNFFKLRNLKHLDLYNNQVRMLCNIIVK